MNPVIRYPDLLKNGLLDEKIAAANDMARHCSLCPRQCGVNRLAGKLGICAAGPHLRVSKALPHFGEEPVLTGTGGSGTIFFAHCNLRCRFCQNYQISHEHLGSTVDPECLADSMLNLQQKGCHNINLVSPAHFLPLILEALAHAAKRGLILPLVYNSNGYERAEVIRMLDGIVDIYLPDAKYGDDHPARILSGAPDYGYYTFPALAEMYRQVGTLLLNEDGIAQRGLIIRHLVLPRDTARTDAVLRTIKATLGTEVHLSLMGQYFPAYHASEHPSLNRRLTDEEYRQARSLLDSYGFENGWCQDPRSMHGSFVPDFSRTDTWN